MLVRLITAAVVTFLALPALAQQGPISVEGAFARASAGNAKNGAAFMTLTNASSQADRLLAAKAGISRAVELHNVVKKGEVMAMTPVEAIPVPAQGRTELKPGSYHVMFLDLADSLKEGTGFPLTLQFEKAGTVTIQVPVHGVGAMPAAPSKGH
ncbi:MAG: copper chaperone PCu(A)C [Rhodospirillales bacterium]|nr:copper chaperone PCu(A)C [Rhodospirillales bacterium]